ncbi:flagellar export protein FliJ [Celerinatantimonas diazotrophica]|uniref:Flagellar FliJ protein n=1 Tax=Celerinatantimonas diazotrophica TaxID=412034 RepID=A0A4V2PPT1_9GAMM|nr:flagellar export protein FliJ [Celerinatantimonas diazotrophica]TCK52131.1 flagellar FliJ protein [Celerinatantimonas diazotrophica]CAG9296164.1 hypothetical protein CEDIAZO_01307 [Celerinatantimonas diazotrophica]
MAINALMILCEQLKKQEQQAVAEFSQARQQLASFEHQLRQLEDYRHNYMLQAMERGSDGMLAAGFHQYQSFIQTIEKAETEQQQSVVQLRTNVERKRQIWLDLANRHKALEQLIERQRQQKAQKQARAEQKLLDEYASMQFVRQSLFPD